MKVNKKDAYYLGKDSKHLVTAVCDGKQMTVVVTSATRITFYSLHRQDEDYHHCLR